MSQADADRILTHLVSTATPAARFVYWNLLVPRDGSNVEGLEAERELADRLHATDRAFFYGRLHIERAGCRV